MPYKQFLLIPLFIHFLYALSLYSCISEGFTNSCSQQLYACTNDSHCSYQLHENTKHININNQTTSIPKLYFSNPKALVLYSCLQQRCNLPPIDDSYVKTLPLDYCMIQVWDICQGDIDKIYQGISSQQLAKQCYKKYCPDLK